MTYATQADMQAAFGDAELIQLTDRSGALDAIDTTVLARALAAADALADNYLATRYALPLSSTPAVLMEACCDIARYELTRGPGLRATDEIKARRDERVAWLRDVAAGRATLGSLSETAAPASAGLPEMTSGGRVFAREED